MENKLGKNIRALRKAYGETQEELGYAINVEKNTISYYETGNRVPSKEVIAEIAKHYMISVDEILKSDLSALDKITVDNKLFLDNIETILPIVSSERALSNSDFQRAFKAHKRIIEGIHNFSMEGMEYIDECIDGYAEAVKDKNCEAEAAANYIAMWYFLLLSIKTVPLIYENQPAALQQVARNDKQAKEIIDNTGDDFINEAKEAAGELSDPELEGYIDNLRSKLKKSEKWYELADYYLALQYIWNIVDNDLGWDFNRRIGVEMMNAFISVGNVYAARFILFSLDSMGQSSQIVDDK